MPYKITRSESYKADQTKSGDSLKHYGRKGMKWDKNIFGKEDVPGQSRSSSSGPPPSKALSSVLNTRVAGPRLLNSTYFNPVTRKDAQKTNMALRSNPGLPLARTPSPNKVRIAGGSSELVKKQTEEPKKDTRNGLQKWFDQAGKDIGKAAGDVKNWGEGAVNDTKKWVEGAANDTKKWADQAGKDIGRAVKTTKNSVEKTVTDAIRGTGQWVEGAANDAKKWTDNAIKDVSKAAVKVGDDAKKVAEKAKTTIDFAVNDAKKWTDTAIKDIGKTAVKIGDDAKKAYGDAEKWVNGAIKDVGKAAVKVGDDAKKAYGDAKKWVDTAIGDAKKWTDQAGKDIGKTAADLADDLVYGTKYAIGTAKYAAKNAASKVKDAYERVTDTGTQRLLNPEHMTSRQKQALWSKKSTKKGIEKNLEEGLGPRVNSYDAFKAIDKKTGGKGYDVVARSGQTQRDLAKLKINSAPPRSRALASKRTPKVKFTGPSMADATKYLNPNELYYYKKGIDYISKFGEGDGSITKELNGYRDKVKREKDRERNR